MVSGIFLALLLLSPCSNSTRADAEKGDSRQVIEKYRYEAIAVESGEKIKELIEMEWVIAESGIRYFSRGMSAREVEEITIHMDPRGNFISGVREVTDRLAGQVSLERVWRENQVAYWQNGSPRTGSRKKFDLVREETLAVGGSFLFLLRSFPFNAQKEWKVFMVDFSGYSARLTVRQAGRERVAVPAGNFDCYRIDSIVAIPILRPRITYWISSRKPHFMVKHEGKRGPFTPSYQTTLLSFE